MPSSKKATERRTERRFSFQLMGTIVTDALPVRNGTQPRAISRNLSPRGAYLISNTFLPVGHQMQLNFTLSDTTRQVRGTVLRVDSFFDEIFGIGVKFEHSGLKDSELARASPPGRPLPPPHSVLRAETFNEPAFELYPQLRKVKTHSRENQACKFSLEKAARIAAMEATYFSWFFHHKVGIPFSVWLRQVRIRQAIELMKREDNSISGIAFAVGFEQLRSFERAFKQCTNLTPREFKRLVVPA